MFATSRTLADILGCLALVVRMVVTIDALERLRSHRQEAGGFPNRHAALHEPSGGGVPKRVRDNGAETGALAGRGEALLDVPDGLTVDVQNVAEIGPAFAGAQQVQQQPRRNADLPAAFFGPRATGNVEVDQTRFKGHLCPPQR